VSAQELAPRRARRRSAITASVEDVAPVFIDRRKNAVVKLKFSRRDCLGCALRGHCTRASRRTVTVRPEMQHAALQAARSREGTKADAREYARRAGIEGTLSQGIRRCGLRRTRYRGLANTHLQHVLTATALNLIRLANWLAGDTPETTRRSASRRPHATSGVGIRQQYRKCGRAIKAGEVHARRAAPSIPTP
jgi:hypothetical protein